MVTSNCSKDKENATVKKHRHLLGLRLSWTPTGTFTTTLRRRRCHLCFTDLPQATARGRAEIRTSHHPVFSLFKDLFCPSPQQEPLETGLETLHPLYRYENGGPETAELAQADTVVALRQKIVPQSEQTCWAESPRPVSTYMPLATGSSPHDTQPCPS